MDAVTDLPDLADHHAPVSDFLALSGDEWPVTAQAARRYRLSDEQVARFERDGFLDGWRVLNEAQLARLWAELAQIMDPAADARLHRLWHEYNSNEAAGSGKELFHSLGAWRLAPSFHDLLFHPAILVPASQLLGDVPLRLWHDQIFSKPPRTGACVAWHQDYSYWTRTTPMQHLTVHIALDDQDAANGVLQYVPGSHRWPLLPVTSRHFTDLMSIRGVLDEAQLAEFETRRAAALPAGGCSFHHALAVHGSDDNTSAAARRATVVNVFRDGTLSASSEPLLEGLPVVPPGQPLVGKFFPLLFAAP